MEEKREEENEEPVEKKEERRRRGEKDREGSKGRKRGCIVCVCKGYPSGWQEVRQSPCI